MNNFTVMTDAQLAAHDASTSKRYQAAAQEAQATIAKQATRIAALEADAARMDFLDSIGAAYGFEDTHEGNRWMIDGPFNSLRAAIDAAIDAAIEKGGA
jgi:hypothetical protein